jgi:hypothetical protein
MAEIPAILRSEVCISAGIEIGFQSREIKALPASSGSH